MRAAPRIVAGAAGITVVNPLRVHEVPWPAVTQVDLIHNVRVHYRSPAGETGRGRRGASRVQAGRGVPVGEKIVHSWAVQSTGRSRTRSELRARRAARRGTTPEPGYARLPDAARTALAGSAAEFIARQLDERARVQRSAAAPGPAPAAADPAAAAPAAAAPAAAAPAVARVCWNSGPHAAMVVPLLILLALTLA